MLLQTTKATFKESQSYATYLPQCEPAFKKLKSLPSHNGMGSRDPFPVMFVNVLHNKHWLDEYSIVCPLKSSWFKKKSSLITC